MIADIRLPRRTRFRFQSKSCKGTQRKTVRNTQNPTRLGQRAQVGKMDSQSNLNVLSDSSKGLAIPERPYRHWEGRAGTNEHMTENPKENGQDDPESNQSSQQCVRPGRDSNLCKNALATAAPQKS
jgi:hypothetical protein